MVIALCGHSFTQTPQAMHPMVQTLVTAFPLAGDEHRLAVG
jgi:hypothetical protein